MGKWKTGELLCEKFRLHRSAAVNRAFRAATKLSEFSDKIGDFEINTHTRSGDFETLLQQQLPKVREAAAGRPIYVVPDDEWFTLYCFFGTEKQVVQKLEERTAQEKAAWKATQFREKMSLEEIAAYGQQWSGEAKEQSPLLGSIWFRHKVGEYTADSDIPKGTVAEHVEKTLEFTGFSGEDVYGKGTRVSFHQTRIFREKYENSSLSYTTREVSESMDLHTHEEIRQCIAEHGKRG